MTIEGLSERLELVERQNRWWRAGSLVGLVVITAMAAMGQAVLPEKTIRAERFEVVDQTGVVQAQFGMSMMGRGSGSPGTPELRLFHRDAKRAELVLTSGGLSILNEAGSLDVQIQSFLKEGPGLIVCDGSGKVLLRAGRGENGTPELWMGDKEGNQLFKAPAK